MSLFNIILESFESIRTWFGVWDLVRSPPNAVSFWHLSIDYYHCHWLGVTCRLIDLELV